MFPPLSTQLWSLNQAKKRSIMRKLEELEEYPKFITIVNEAGYWPWFSKAIDKMSNTIKK